MSELMVIMLERVGMIVAVAFILTRFDFFKNMVYHDTLNRKQEITAIAFFGFFGIIGTYFGVAFNTNTQEFTSVAMNIASDEAIANSRVIGVVVAGLLGGYRLGLGAGLIAGIHRITLGGFTGLACGISTIVAGLVAGAFYKKGKDIKPVMAFAIGALAETMQMGVILLLSKPFEQALSLVQAIGIPMILANGIGTAIFLLIVYNVISDQEKVTALQAQKTLRIANQTLGYLRKGMTADTAAAVCGILHRELAPSAVSMTNQTEILAHVGLASDHHKAHSPIQTKVTKEVLQHGELIVANEQAIHCMEENCPLGAAVVAPLKQRGETIGTIKLYYPSEKAITDVSMELIDGLSSLLSDQLEIAHAEQSYQLAKEAEIKVLQAQISPHFLFNSMNIIVSLIRTDPDQARQLLNSLSYFLRQNLAGTTASKVTLQQELHHVHAYLQIEQARFIDKLSITLDVDETVLNEMIPPLTLQPLVENAVKHGIRNMEKDCHISISIQPIENEIAIEVADNGEGINEERLKTIGVKEVESIEGTGLGLFNVNRRLTMTFGERAALHFDSTVGKGTTVHFRIPHVKEGEHIESYSSASSR
ncbi:sensor histidine kinase [Paenisporosarcina cavernae]|uniref:histidine kinase n=1 Tax=Paenisporosarcina cavernae TaxID=2320858 RepID=A0A385YUH9_9BACL|nr:sensor histidine kinase [Paenisporosarcina cavernae]AYC30519.1 sensor histidine kinase [Paenisporosarcina cavernae]